MPAGGRVTIATANLQLHATDDARGNGVRPGAYVTLAVTDTGIGMDVPTQARIFDPFFTTKEPGKGTGLGLSTVYGIVEQSGGHIAVESAPGPGSHVHHLPAAPCGRRRSPRKARRTGGASRAGPRRCWWWRMKPRCDRRRGACWRATGIPSSRHDTAPTRSASSRRAIGQIDLVLTDLVMPEMGGRELVERLRTRHPAMKVLFMSGYSERAVNTGGAMPPGTGFLEKPFTVEQLTRRTREMLDA